MNILIADDHTLFRDALTHYIERSHAGASIIQAADYNEAIKKLEHMDAKPDLVLLDLNMPGMNGVDGFKNFRAKYPDIRVALLSGVAEPDEVRTIMGMGACAYFPKTLSGRAILSAIELVLNGENFIPVDPETNWLMPAYKASQQPKSIKEVKLNSQYAAQLTPREKDVLKLLCEGHSNKAISHLLGLQTVTIKLHIRGICRKLEAANRTQAALKAVELGLVEK
jgi:DNA-binding NarL/FixJ family response regulator